MSASFCGYVGDSLTIANAARGFVLLLLSTQTLQLSARGFAHTLPSFDDIFSLALCKSIEKLLVNSSLIDFAAIMLHPHLRYHGNCKSYRIVDCLVDAGMGLGECFTTTRD